MHTGKALSHWRLTHEPSQVYVSRVEAAHSQGRSTTHLLALSGTLTGAHPRGPCWQPS